jgi:hypothetical protein
MEDNIIGDKNHPDNNIILTTQAKDGLVVFGATLTDGRLILNAMLTPEKAKDFARCIYRDAELVEKSMPKFPVTPVNREYPHRRAEGSFTCVSCHKPVTQWTEGEVCFRDSG